MDFTNVTDDGNKISNVITFVTYSFGEILELYVASEEYVNDKGEVAHDGQYMNCTRANPYEYSLSLSTRVLSLLMIIVMSFMTQRVSFLKNICNGRPGPLSPMMPLDNHDNGFEYSLAFLTISEYIYEFIFEGSSKILDSSPITNFISKLAYVLILAILSYPIFVAITYRHVVAYICGILLLGLDLFVSIVNIYYKAKCSTSDKAVTVTFRKLFSTIFMGILLCILVRRLIRHVIRNRCRLQDSKNRQRADEDLCDLYVKNVLDDKGRLEKVQEKPKDENFFSAIWNAVDCYQIGTKVTTKIHRKVPGFRVPPRLIIGLLMGTYFAYHIAIDHIDNLTPTGWRFLKLISQKSVTTNMDPSTAFKIIYGNDSKYELKHRFNAYRYVIFLYFHLIISCFVAGILISFGNAIIHCFLIFRNYRLHFHRIARKGFSAITSARRTRSASSLVLGFVRFSGFQAAFILWSIMVVFVITTILLYLVIGFVLIPLFFIEKSAIRSLFISSAPVLVITFLFNLSQTLLVKYVFVSDKGEVMQINNRRAFDIYCHFAFFLNVLMGVFGSLKRVVVWMFSGIICFCRLDFTALPEYIQECDSGYISYIGFLYTEQYHYNPILRCFINILLKENSKLKVKSSDEIKRKVNYSIKWRVAYTLVNNPQLISMKKVFERHSSLKRGTA